MDNWDVIEFTNMVACRGLWPGGKNRGGIITGGSQKVDECHLPSSYVKQFAIENGDL